MRKGSYLPTYKCVECGQTWKRGGQNKQCHKCGLFGLHRCIKLGCDGIIHQFKILTTQCTEPAKLARDF